MSKVSKTNYDFSGWVTKNNIRCADGLHICNGAFSTQDGEIVPLVWNHGHESVRNILGHTLLENRPEGVYGYSKFNDTDDGVHAKKSVTNGDITTMSIYADNLSKDGPGVKHGVIREVSLVVAGANPGARIESVLAHGISIGDEEDEAIIYTGEALTINSGDVDVVQHSSEGEKEKEGSSVSDEKKETGGGKTVMDVWKTLNEEQQKAVAIIVGQAIEDAKAGGKEKENEEEKPEMKHNAFYNTADGEERITLSHSQVQQIFADGKRLGSLKAAWAQFSEENDVIMHSLDTTGMTVSTGNQEYGFNDPSMLFPEFRSLNTPPEWISRNMDWVTKVMSSVHRTPFSRVKSVYADITEDEARAKGYMKGNRKKEEVFTVLKRTTSPQTVYKKQKMDRDDIIDITEFDVIAWIKAEMRVMLNEELARAFLIGDGRPSDSEDKIHEQNIRPIVKDDPLFNTIIKVTVPANATPAEVAEVAIEAIIRGKKHYKGSGSPTFWANDDYITDMLLLKDTNKHRLYKTEAELATTLRVKEIVQVEPMEGYEIEIDSVKYPLIGTIVNLTDYNVGADKGGAVEMFDDFDLDFNQQKYLIETRCSGALIKPFSALTIVLDKSGAAG